MTAAIERLFRLALVVLVGCFFFAWGGTVRADLLDFEANLDGTQEVPPNASPGIGFAQFTLDTTSDTVTISEGNFSDLLGGVTGITLNGLAAPGSNAAVLINFALGDAAGLTTGNFAGSGTLADDPTANGMISGETYLNIRSSVYPSGEIRGKVLQAPEPSGVILLITAALVWGAIVGWPKISSRRSDVR